MIVETPLPAKDARCVSVAVDSLGCSGLEIAYETGEITGFQLQQPMQVIWHENEGESFAAPQFVAAMQFSDGQAGESEIGKKRVALVSDGGGQVDQTGF
ncbi:MAG: hypothetical protein A2Z95_03135 [Gallionellales bacterium GWA2_60_18]|nr:MAG: hypothetical protein A2Z95_03135 [Gallionellales bacterium GWA2_60_18]